MECLLIAGMLFLHVDTTNTTIRVDEITGIENGTVYSQTQTFSLGKYMGPSIHEALLSCDEVVKEKETK